MAQNEYRIKHLRSDLIAGAVLTAIFILFGSGMLINALNEGSREGGLIILLVIIVVMLIAFVGLLRKLYLGRNEIILTSAGIEIVGLGLFSWEMIENFSTVEDDDSESVILHFKEFAAIRISLLGLEKNRNEIIDLILAWKGSSDFYYAGHKKE